MTDKNKNILSAFLVIIGVILLLFSLTRVINKKDWDVKSFGLFIGAMVLVITSKNIKVSIPTSIQTTTH